MRDAGVLHSRRATRAAVISTLWRTGGAFRPDIAQLVGLTEASVFRIVHELKDDGVVEETRRKAPYPGGPSAFMALSGSINLAVLEASGGRLHAAIGLLTGQVVHSAVHELPDGRPAADVRAVFERAVAGLAGAAAARGTVLEQVAVAVPGHHPAQPVNPVLALDAAALEACLDATWPGVPVTVANSIVARAVACRNRSGMAAQRTSSLFVYAGHGVGAALVDGLGGRGGIEPLELGHVIADPAGAACRCGHRGCLETVASSAAVLRRAGVADAVLAGPGMGGVLADAGGRRSVRAGAQALGRAIGNALNLVGRRPVVIAGWPCALPDDERGTVRAAIDAALLGGADGVDIGFLADSFGREPSSGLALAGHAFVQRGGERAIKKGETG